MAHGRHRAPSRRMDAHAVALVVVAAMVVAVAALTALADDPRLLRTAGLVGLLAALLPAMVLAAGERPVRPDNDVAALRDEIARLRAELTVLSLAVRQPTPPAARQPAAQPAAQPTAQPAPDRVATTLQLPLVRAALRGPMPVNGNGHNGHSAHLSIDLTDDAVRLR